jgi:hypothetical protein
MKVNVRFRANRTFELTSPMTGSDPNPTWGEYTSRSAAVPRVLSFLSESTGGIGQ